MRNQKKQKLSSNGKKRKKSLVNMSEIFASKEIKDCPDDISGSKDIIDESINHANEKDIDNTSEDRIYEILTILQLKVIPHINRIKSSEECISTTPP